ncbi:MAG: HNH endonuclease signature motif containing protein [Pseudomonadota bacterium]
MAKRAFRSPESIEAEIVTRDRVQPLLERQGFVVTGQPRIAHGTAITQVIEAHLPAGPPMRIHVRLCWGRHGRHAREDLYSAAQLKARLDEGGWVQTLANIAARHERERHTHVLLVQDSRDAIVLAALIPSVEIPAIWARQRDVSADLLSRGLAGRQTKNHAANGSSPSLWLQDDRHPDTAAVAKVLWDWPGVVNVLALPRQDSTALDTDTLDDLSAPGDPLGRDGGERQPQVRSGYPRDARVRAAVRERALGRCERESCGEHRAYPGFLDVHHILGVEVSDRVWTCVALCPNCHREAHFSPDRDAINAALRIFAGRFA